MAKEKNSLRKMSRQELIEVIYAMKSNEETLREAFEKEKAAWEEERTELNRKISDREIRLKETGSIAAAAMEIHRVFEASQAAADDYLASVKAAADRQAEEILAQAKEQARGIIRQAEEGGGA